MKCEIFNEELPEMGGICAYVMKEGERCGGFIRNRTTCEDGYKCVLKIPADLGGTCQKVLSNTGTNGSVISGNVEKTRRGRVMKMLSVLDSWVTGLVVLAIAAAYI
jgi:hypothetical protein